MKKKRIRPKLLSREDDNLMRKNYCFNKQDIRNAYNNYIGSIYYEIKDKTIEEIEEIDQFCDLYGYEYAVTIMTTYNEIFRKYVAYWEWIK